MRIYDPVEPTKRSLVKLTKHIINSIVLYGIDSRLLKPVSYLVNNTEKRQLRQRTF